MTLLRLVADNEDFLIRRAGGEGDRATLAATTTTGVALAIALHAADVDQRGAVGRGQLRSLVGLPQLLVDFVVHRRQPGEQAEHAAHRAQVPAPDALTTAIEEANDHRGHRRAAKDQRGSAAIVINADQLAVDGGQHEGDGRPTAPANPLRGALVQPAPAGPFTERAFRAEHPAPEPAEEHHRQQHERPPQAPEQELGEHRDVVQHPRFGGRQRKHCWQQQQDQIEADYQPLDQADGGAVLTQQVADAHQPGGVGDHAVRASRRASGFGRSQAQTASQYSAMTITAASEGMAR